MSSIVMCAILCLPLSAMAAGDKPVTVGGMVRTPGEIEFKEGLTLAEAIKQAGGANEFGSLKKVTVNRNGETTRHDLTSEKGGSHLLEPSDEVVIPQKLLCGEDGSN